MKLSSRFECSSCPVRGSVKRYYRLISSFDAPLRTCTNRFPDTRSCVRVRWRCAETIMTSINKYHPKTTADQWTKSESGDVCGGVVSLIIWVTFCVWERRAKEREREGSLRRFLTTAADDKPTISEKQQNDRFRLSLVCDWFRVGPACTHSRDGQQPVSLFEQKTHMWKGKCEQLPLKQF